MKKQPLPGEQEYQKPQKGQRIPNSPVRIALASSPNHIARPILKRTPLQLERQEKAFFMSITDGKSNRRIAQDLNVSQQTIASDIKYEEQRRSAELEDRRDDEKARAVSLYQDIIRRCVHKSDMYDRLVASGAGGGISDTTMAAATKARERIDCLLGLNAATRIDVGIAVLTAALGDLPE